MRARLARRMVVVALVAACTARPGAAWAETGEASWVARSLRGRRTASGARYDPRALTAAHRTLPFGTQVRVTRLDTGRSVIVTVTDRGPWVGGRVIDVSEAAADALGFQGRGTAPVRLTLP
ncbi:septal ring lytic transglycosylase RlpA family protein [Elioraea sp.]|jgi:rare lipoprotein A|uniref:septal ring lytic transglycosylase RlpA family protein n=1 Tax=Elioraea sp. TaxID=2185103 RepID=UPI003F70B431